MSTVKIRTGCLFWVLPSGKGLLGAEYVGRELAFGGNSSTCGCA